MLAIENHRLHESCRVHTSIDGGQLTHIAILTQDNDCHPDVVDTYEYSLF